MMEKLSRPSVAVAVVTLLMLVFGAWQHVMFSFWVGEPEWFKNAYDEDTYILFSGGLSDPRLDRMLSDGVAALFLLVSGGSFGAALILFDLLFPPIIFLASYFLATRLFEQLGIRLLFCVLLMFSADLLSLGNSSSFLSRFVTLDHFRRIVDLFGTNLVPPIETSYPTLLRSPEPQVAYVVAFVFCGLLVETVRRGGHVAQPALWLALAGAQVLLTLSYSLISLPLLMVEAFAAALLLACRDYRAAALLGALCVLSFAAMFAAYVGLEARGSLVFFSRLPSVSTAVLGGLALLCVIGVLLLKRGGADRMLWLAIAFTGLPIALMNQQVLTGFMVSTRDWERYVNHPMLVIGMGIVVSSLGKSAGGRFLDRSSPLAAVATIALSLIVFLGLNQATLLWRQQNETVLAMAKAIDAAPDQLDGWTLVLKEPGLAPALAVRRGGKRDYLIDYTDIFLDWIPSLATSQFRLTRHGEAAFEYWRLRGFSQEEVADVLETEMRARNGYYSAFFFNICDYWFPCTDDRAVLTDAIAVHIPEILTAYGTYLQRPSGRFEGHRFAFIATGDAATLVSSERFESVPVSRSTVGSTTASVHLQK